MEASVLDYLLEFANIWGKPSDLALGMQVKYNNFRLMPESSRTVCAVTSSFRKPFVSANCEKYLEVFSNDIFTFLLLRAASCYFCLRNLHAGNVQFTKFERVPFQLKVNIPYLKDLLFLGDNFKFASQLL